MHLEAKYHSRLVQSNSLLFQVITILAASIALAAASQITIPWQPVPFTFQSAMVVLLGLVLGAKRATLAVALYLFEAAIGLPVLAGFTGGLPILLGSTAGYLFGFLPAAFLAGFLMERGMAKSVVRIFLTAILSAAVIFAFGVSYLSSLIGWQQAVALGVMPFVLTEPLKLMIASILAAKCWSKNN